MRSIALLSPLDALAENGETQCHLCHMTAPLLGAQVGLDYETVMLITVASFLEMVHELEKSRSDLEWLSDERPWPHAGSLH